MPLLGFLEYLEEAAKPYLGIWLHHPHTGAVHTGTFNGSSHRELAQKGNLPTYGKAFDNLHRGTYTVFHKEKKLNIGGYNGVYPHKDVVNHIAKKHHAQGYEVTH